MLLLLFPLLAWLFIKSNKYEILSLSVSVCFFFFFEVTGHRENSPGIIIIVIIEKKKTQKWDPTARVAECRRSYISIYSSKTVAVAVAVVVVVLVLVGLTFTDTVPSLFILYLASLYPNSLLSLSLSFFFFSLELPFFYFLGRKKN